MHVSWVNLMLVGALAWVGSAAGNSYVIGNFRTLDHDVSGTVEALSATRLRVTNFNFDGDAPDAFFWAGLSGDVVDASGTIIPVQRGSTEKLGAYTNAELILNLPDNLLVYNIKWLSVWCRQAEANFGDIFFPSDLQSMIPAPLEIGTLSQLAHDVSSGVVTILDTKTFMIRSLTYDGTGPDAFFTVGTGTPSSSGTKVPNEFGNLDILGAYDNKDVVIRLQGNLEMKDIEYLSIYCFQATQDFGNIDIPSNPYVPLFLEGDGLSELPNCIQLHERMNVAWELAGNELTIELIGGLEPNEYMAFGMSGSTTAMQMIGGEVVVATMVNGVPVAEDYSLQAKSLCAGNSGSCPVTSLNGANQASIQGSTVINGVTRIRVTRPLWGSGNELQVIWAIGPYSQQTNLATKHSIRGGLLLDFADTGNTACADVTVPDQPDLPAWAPQSLSGVTTFNMEIGPAGGERGYTGITNRQSWGIAWYVNGLLIPEITVQRGQTYTFRVSGGNDPSNSAKYHPIYLTSSESGGKNDGQTGETVYMLTDANDQQVEMGTGPLCEYKAPSGVTGDDYDNFEAYKEQLNKECPQGGSPGIYTWTPSDDTPDKLFYQCYTHRFLGWKINVEAPPVEDSGTVAVSLTTTSLLLVTAITTYWLQ